MFDFREIKRLVELVQSSDIGELEVSRFWSRVKIRKRAADAKAEVVPSVGHETRLVEMPRSATSVPHRHEPSAPEPGESAAPDLVPIRSPMVGTFYRAPAPDSEPYVEVGSVIRAGEVVCIIEAMKLMNEIESDVHGKIVKVLVENAQPVQYDQTLFLVQAS
jgi:acetyl-CoA carboxylase biotin carboxyl carrier protein